MKYNVGDKVRIKNIDWYNTNKDEDGIVELSTHVFTPGMPQFCGRVMTISHVGIDYYTMVEDLVGYWTDEMIEGLIEDESANYSKVIDNGVSNLITAKTSLATIDVDKGFYSYSDSDGNLEMEWNLPQGYQFKDQDGNVINATKIVLEKKSPKNDDIIKWLRENDMTKYIGVIYSGMCSITFDTEGLIKDFLETAEDNE